jgi:hypothetical protein
VFYLVGHDGGIGGDVHASDEKGEIKMKLTFFVPGIASPSGSKKAFAHPKTGRIIVMDTAKRKTSWQSIVSLHAQQAMIDAGAKLTTEAVAPPEVPFWERQERGQDQRDCPEISHAET